MGCLQQGLFIKNRRTRQEQASQREIILRFLADLARQDGLLEAFDEELCMLRWSP